MVLPDPWTPELTQARRARLQHLLADQHAGAPFIVSDPLNVRYLSGFDGSNGALLILGGDVVLFTDFRYLLQAAEQSPGIEVRKASDTVGAALDAVGQQPALLEGHHLAAGRWVAMQRDNPVLQLVGDVIAGLRSTKDEAEVTVLEHACQISVAALQQVLADGVAGRTERDIARRLEWLLADSQGEGPGFASIVAAGPNSAVPHHSPTTRQLVPGDLLKIDFGARVRGYHADITRTFVVAADPEPWQRDIHSLVADAQAAGRLAAIAGAAIADVDRAARDLIVRAGHGEHFGHGLGHGVGLAIHERPLIGAGVAGTLGNGMAITIEPGVYLPGRGGVRIEDTVLVGPDGCRSLVQLTRDLVTVR